MDLQEFIKLNVPRSPGIYIFRDKSQGLLYIGKAKCLKTRVQSYWNENSWRDRPKLMVLVPQIHSVETIVVNNEKEALILEASLIYKHQPKYNVLLKSNKSFPWLGITYGEDFPRLVVVRDLKSFKRKFPKAKLFGPYTDSEYMYQVFNVLHDMFALRRRAKALHPDRPCLNYHIDKCPGPCQNLITTEEYSSTLRSIELFFSGSQEELIKLLTQKMLLASKELNFEKAAKYRDQINTLHRSIESQRIITDDPNSNRDIIGFAVSGEDLSIQLFKMRHGKLVNREHYLLDLNEYQNIEESIDSSIQQIYLLRESHDIPKEIIIQSNIVNHNLKESYLKDSLEEFLVELSSSKTHIAFPQKGPKKEQIKLASENAQNSLEELQRNKTKQLQALEELQQALNLKELPISIDCFDISHLQGTNVVASCVHLHKGLPLKDKYRRFKLSIDQNDDFASMKEVVKRRYHNKNHEVPHIILIDGGKGQLRSAKEALLAIHVSLDNTILISIAKKEEIIHTLSGSITLPFSSKALHILQRARDEAHRFAVTYNKTLRQKKISKSILDDIPGIGKTTKQKLLENFKPSEIPSATSYDISQRLDISLKKAQNIHKKLQQNLTHGTPNSDKGI